MNKDSTLPKELVYQLTENYNNLVSYCVSIEKKILSEHNLYPVFVPSFGASNSEHQSIQARKEAIKSITRLSVNFTNEYIAEAGILCASPETIQLIIKFNTAKDLFKLSVAAIKNFHKEKDASSSRIAKLINNEVTIKGYRTTELKKAMHLIGIENLDLKRCYANIRIMPPNLETFSWTWATKHTRIKKITFHEAIEMAKKLKNPNASQVAIALIEKGCSPSEILVKKVKLQNQLRANYVFYENNQLVRKACPISGIVIAQQNIMPRKLWRNNPGVFNSKERLQRLTGISEKPLVYALDLYKYK